jgi:heterotetrameric sarcosine oxidase gamma subunit
VVERTHPLAALAANAADCPAAQLTVLPPATRLIVRADTTSAASVGAALGVLLGSVPCRAVNARERAALWLGPDEWLVLAPEFESALAEHVTTANASVVDVSHRDTAIGIAGPRAAWCLNSFNMLDLDPGVFPVGACARTLFGKAQIVLWHTEPQAFHIEVARSYAPYVWQCLEQARRELVGGRVSA